MGFIHTLLKLECPILITNNYKILTIAKQQFFRNKYFAKFDVNNVSYWRFIDVLNHF